jgi:hypothetical protein
MCISWERLFIVCLHTEPTNIYLFCHKYRHTRYCPSGNEKVKHIKKKGLCSACHSELEKEWKGLKLDEDNETEGEGGGKGQRYVDRRVHGEEAC